MARVATPTELAASGERPLELSDVPAQFLPSNWRHWLDSVHATGHDTDELNGRRRLFEVQRARSENYRRWLAARGLVNDIGQPVEGWTSGDLAAWEGK